MAALNAQSIDRGGLVPAYANAAAGGDTFTPSNETILHVKNGSGSAMTVTVATPGTEIGLDIADVEVAVAAGAEAMIGPFPHEHFADPADGQAHVTYTDATSVTVAVLEISQP